MTTDIVCGSSVDEGKARAAGFSCWHQGRMYYFCCEECRIRFEHYPDLYLLPDRPEVHVWSVQRTGEYYIG